MRGGRTIVALALAGLLAACGGEDEDEDLGADLLDPEPTEDPTPAEDPEPTEDPEDDAESAETYEVQSGDTLIGIAEEFGVEVDDLIDANDIDDPDLLQVGEELVIP